MLSRTRMFLDEAVETFYDTDEIYEALSQAQKEIGNIVANHWFNNLKKGLQALPQTLKTLETTTSATLTAGQVEITIATMLMPITFILDSVVRTYVQPTAEGRFIMNSPITSDGKYYWHSGTKIMIPVALAGNASYTLYHLIIPTDINGSTQPVLHEVAHDAIIERALWILMSDENAQLAQTHLQLYQAQLQGLMQ